MSGEGGARPEERARRSRRRILYLSKEVVRPIGGIRVAHQHVALLQRNGFDARIVLIDEDPGTPTSLTVPVEWLKPSLTIYASDLIVIPEPWGTFMRQLQRHPVRRYVFCQNHFYIHQGLAGLPDYAAAGIDTVFCCSEVIADYLLNVMGLDRAPIIHNAIDRQLFRPYPKRRQIAFMPRKMAVEAGFLEATFRRRHPDLADVPWVEIAGQPPGEVARILGESAVFLALGRNEGFGLPPVEAMACGCIVVGFLGDGGRSYATAENGLWCAADDWLGCTDSLAEAVRRYDSDGGKALVAGGVATVSEYTSERMERELVEFWQAEIER